MLNTTITGGGRGYYRDAKQQAGELKAEKQEKTQAVQTTNITHEHKQTTYSIIT